MINRIFMVDRVAQVNRDFSGFSPTAELWLEKDNIHVVLKPWIVEKAKNLKKGHYVYVCGSLRYHKNNRPHIDATEIKIIGDEKEWTQDIPF